MPNIASVLKQEIARVARKEIRQEIEPIRRAAASYKKQVAALKRRADSLERLVAKLQKSRPAVVRERDTDSENPSLRFRPAGLKGHRERLGLSAREVGQLVGASQLSVYKWEQGKARPRAKHLAAIAELRKLGKKEAAARLEQLAA